MYACVPVHCSLSCHSATISDQGFSLALFVGRISNLLKNYVK